MSFSLIPGLMCDRLTDLTPELLASRGVTFLMMDFDNTIVPYTTNVPTAEMEQWLQTMQKSKIGLCVVSNSKRGRVVKFCEQRRIPCITHAKKPFSRGIRECQRRFHLDLSHTALVGDQIYTDVLGANCAGAQSILIRAIHNHNIWLKLRHGLEMPFIWIGRYRQGRRITT